MPVYGYGDTLLRVNLREKTVRREPVPKEVLENWLGGTGLGVKIMYEEVPTHVQWDDPENKIIFACGALSGMPACGTGAYGVTTKGALTGGLATSQAMGSFGALMKYAGYVGIVFEDASDEWVYLYIDGDTVELKDARHLVGLDSIETQDKLHEEYGRGEYEMSVSCIGPAGENGVRFAMITGDYGHVAAHNGVGSVLGKKKVKAVAINKRIHRASSWWDVDGMRQTGKDIYASAMLSPVAEETVAMGTNAGFVPLYRGGILPIKNLNTSIMEEHTEFWGKTLRDKFEYKHSPCWGCTWTHCGTLKVKDGPNKGKVFEEPEYEALAGMGTIIFNKDNEKGIQLTDRLDRLGMDCNETGWLMGWAIECYEKGYITKEETGGIELTWGNADAVYEILWKIAYREGIGDFLAEGIKRCAEARGGEAQKCAVYTLKGNTPRGHDHRSDWKELLDICVSSTGTVEVVGGGVNVKQHGEEPVKDKFDPLEIARYNYICAGRRVVEDSLGICRMITAEDITNTANAMHYATGDEWSIDRLMRIGKR
ncbi:MAG: hypothetical protein LBD12_04590, partial [Clostridiales Family XIII bacterium]|nr:hypothetical protein [Clostridiales Family XIII bacterium]